VFDSKQIYLLLFFNLNSDTVGSDTVSKRTKLLAHQNWQKSIITFQMSLSINIIICA